MKKYEKYLLNKSSDTSGMLSVSQMLSFMKCRKAWQYSYEKNLTPRIERPYLTIGKLCHQGMQGAWTAYAYGNTIEESIRQGIARMRAYFNRYKETVVLLEEEVPIIEQLLVDSEVIFTNAFNDFDPTRYKVVMLGSVPAIELHFKLPLAGTRGMHGFIDLIVCDKTNNQIWLVDYKFRSSLSDNNDEQFNLQNTVYLKAARMLGIHCTGSMTYQYLNTPPSIPSVNKNGTVSRAKIKTTWAQYAAFCEAVGQDPNDYAEEMIPKLAEIEWFRATKEIRSDEMVDMVWNSVVRPTASEIVRKSKKCVPSMHPMNCRMCSFADVCQGELRGYDVQYIIDAEFMDKAQAKFDIDDFEYENVNKIFDTPTHDVV